MKTLILPSLMFLIALPSFGAIAAGTVWEVRTTGAATNGGGYSTGGTDMSQFDNKNAASCTSCQSATINISTTDAVTAGTTTITSATANFSSAIVGNTIYVTGGTGSVAAARYQVVTFTNSTTIVVDRSTGLTSGTGATMNIGGALGDATAGVQQAATSSVAGNTIYVKAGTYTVTATVALAGTGGVGVMTTWIGYTTIRTDGGKPTIQASSGTAGAMLVFQERVGLRHFIIDANAQTNTQAISNNNTDSYIYDVEVKGCTGSGTYCVARGSVLYSRIHGTASGCNGVYLDDGSGVGIHYSVIDSNACTALVLAASAATFNIIANNSGATTDGIKMTSSSRLRVDNNTFYNNGRDDLRLEGAGAGDGARINNNVFWGSAGKAIDSTVTNYAWALGDYNAYASGATANITAGPNDVILTASPYVNAAGNNFAPNATAGAGGAVRALGFPGAFLGLSTTGALDIGAVQHADSGGGPKSFSYTQ